VSKTTNVDGTGETLTVSGTGFDATGTLGTRAPLSGKPAGVYVVFGSVADTWRPSTGAGSATRQVIAQRWAIPQVSYDFSNGSANPLYVLMNPDGSFTTTLAVSNNTAFTHPNVGIVTYPGSGATNAAVETFTPITFSVPEPI
jgi:hypothetical protein